jgi:RNA polymerase sigma factor (sigma-70 family)
MAESRKALIERLFAEHGGALQAYFRRRLRRKPDASDLTQEVYLRLLRVKESEVLRNPEAYLYTVASNLMKEHAVLDQRLARAEDVEDPAFAVQLAELPAFDGEVDTESRLKRLNEVLEQLSPKCRAAVVLQYSQGLSYQEIGERLGISANMVKKYLVQALAHCRKRMVRWS